MDKVVELGDSLSPEGMIDIATEHHQAGRLEDAAMLYRRVLDAGPRHVDANHLLGVIAYQEDRFDTAVELIGEALRDRPASDAIRVNLGRALIGAGRMSEGAEALWSGGYYDEAEEACREAIARTPEDYLLYILLSRILMDDDRPREAESVIYEAFRRTPERDASAGNGTLDPSEYKGVAKAFTYCIDIVGTCNLRCPSCPVGNLSDIERPKGFMDVGLFEEIVKKIKSECQNETPDLWLFNWGEPFLHPKLPEIIRIAKTHAHPVMLSSNMNTKLDLKEVIRAEPETIKISLSGMTQEVYGETHVRGNIEMVKENMRKLRRYIDEFDAKTYVWVGYHMYRHNIGDYGDAVVFANSLNFDFVPFVAFFQPLEKMVELVENKLPDVDKTLVDLLIEHPLVGVIMNKRIADPAHDCQLRSKMMTINHDGSVALCCGVYEPENMLGVKFTDLPHQELQALKYEHDFCKTCYKSHLPFLPIPPNRPEKNDVIHERQKENLYRKLRQSRGQE